MVEEKCLYHSVYRIFIGEDNILEKHILVWQADNDKPDNSGKIYLKSNLKDVDWRVLVFNLQIYFSFKEIKNRRLINILFIFFLNRWFQSFYIFKSLPIFWHARTHAPTYLPIHIRRSKVS